jgi:hypothetical protein
MAIAGWFSRERKENYGKEQISLDIEQAVSANNAALLRAMKDQFLASKSVERHL